MNKFHATRTYNSTCKRWFASKAEARRGMELALMERAGAISRLEYQVKFILSKAPKVTLAVDFGYKDENGKQVYEDVKGAGETREFRVKRIWLKQLKGYDILLTK